MQQILICGSFPQRGVQQPRFTHIYVLSQRRYSQCSFIYMFCVNWVYASSTGLIHHRFVDELGKDLKVGGLFAVCSPWKTECTAIICVCKTFFLISHI